MTRYLLLAYALGIIATASASEIDFSFNTDNLPVHGYGFDKAETYDVAIRIDEPSLKGSVIKGISVELPGGDAISGCSGWLSNELNLKRVNGKYVNQPDITSTDGKLSDGALTVTFSEPYTVDGPVYVGYTFTVGELVDGSGEPVMVADGINADGLYLHTSRSRLKWNSVSSDVQGVSAMKVIIEGDFKDNAAAFAYDGALGCSAEDESVTFTLNIANHGQNPVEKVAYRYSVAGLSGENEVAFPTPIPANWGALMPIELTIGQIADPGNYELTLEVLSVNGAANTDASPTTVMPLTVYPFIPVNRPLVEEYTGLWCGWCPRGYVALETMHEEYPDRFVGVAYHSGDAMASVREFPSSPNGFPDGFINRTRASLGDIYTIWPRYAESSTPADINVSVQWTDETQSALKATSSTRFMESKTKADYGVSYILVADGLSDPTWEQSNSYAPAEGEEPGEWDNMPGKWGELFTHGTNPMMGLVFNDVAMDLKYVDGFPGSIPTEITTDETITHSCVFTLDEIRKIDIVKDRSKLRVVAVLIDRKSGKPVNCNTSLYPDGGSGVGEITDPGVEVVSTEWYSPQGMLIASPAKGIGIVIRIDHLSDGTTKSSKQLF